MGTGDGGMLGKNVYVAVEADWVYLIGSILDTPFFSVFLMVRRFIEICKIPRGDTNEDCWKKVWGGTLQK